MQVAFNFAGEIAQVLDATPWVRCASGNVFLQAFLFHLRLAFFWSRFLFDVGKEIEIGEKNKEDSGVGDEDLWHYFGVSTVERKWEKCVDENTDKLDHLEPGQILLPPEEGLHLRSKRREEIVEVHHLHQGEDSDEDDDNNDNEEEEDVMLTPCEPQR